MMEVDLSFTNINKFLCEL